MYNRVEMSGESGTILHPPQYFWGQTAWKWDWGQTTWKWELDLIQLCRGRMGDDARQPTVSAYL